MLIQIVVIILACVIASLVALSIAGVSLSLFGKFLKRTNGAAEE